VILERVTSAVVKHLGLEDTVRFFTPSKESQTDEFVLLTSVMEEICRRTDALVRQLQVKYDCKILYSNHAFTLFCGTNFALN
jgi:hypothetical protein